MKKRIIAMLMAVVLLAVLPKKAGTVTSVTVMAVILKATDMTYDPRILWNPVTARSCLFYAGYAALCLMPLGLELWTEYSFQKARGTQ